MPVQEAVNGSELRPDQVYTAAVARLTRGGSGGRVFMVKPFLVSDLLKQVRSLLDGEPARDPA